MAVSYLNYGSGLSSSPSNATIDATFHAGSASNRIILAFANAYGGASVTAVEIVGGAASTLVRNQNASDNKEKLACYVLTSPPSGSTTVRMTASAAASYPNLEVWAFGGVDQTTPISGNVGVTTSTQNPVVTPTVTVPVDGFPMAACSAYSNAISFTPANPYFTGGGSQTSSTP
jgi:hypothetical protein